MTSGDFTVLRDSASTIQIENHLKRCNDLFEPSLDSYVDIQNYALKIMQRAHRFEIFEGSQLICLLAVYLNVREGRAFITNISVEKIYQGHGIASLLVETAMRWLRGQRCNFVELEVWIANKKALKFYELLEFKKEKTRGSKLVLKKII